MKPLLTALLFGLSTSLFAQKTIKVDLDGDKILDKVTLTKPNEMGFGNKILYTLSTQKNRQFSSGVIEGGRIGLEAKKNILIVTISPMRSVQTAKFRYDKALKQVKLIGYDDEQFGNGMNDGSGHSSYNLLTGQYEALWHRYDEEKKKLVAQPKIVKTIPAKTHLLKGFTGEVPELESVAENSVSSGSH
jgi:hypothetical protein